METIDYIKQIDQNSERRFFVSNIEIREADNIAPARIQGYAAVFDSPSVDFGGWTETIDPEAFNEVLKDDAFALFNHDPNLVLARNNVNLTLSVDKRGLLYSFNMPNTSLGKDLAELIRSNVITKSSFAFRVKAQEWIHTDGQASKRIIKKVGRLYDVSPVTYPAYPETSIGTRAFKQELESKQPNVNWAAYIDKLSVIHSY